MRSSRLLKKFIYENSEDDWLLKNLAEKLVSDKELEDRIFDTFDESLRIKQNATPELKGLYSSLRDTEQNLRDQINSLLNNSTFSKYLQDNIYTQRDDRIVFQVMATNKIRFPGLCMMFQRVQRLFILNLLKLYHSITRLEKSNLKLMLNALEF